MIYVILLIFVCVLVAWALYLRYNHTGRLLAKIPGPTIWPIIGNTFDIIQTSEELFIYARYLFKEYGNISRLCGFGIQCVNVYHPDDVEIIMSTTRFNEKHRPYTFIRPWLSDGLLTSNGEKWHQRRKLLTPAFHFNILKKFMRTFNEQAEDLQAQIHKIIKDGDEKTNLMPLIAMATMHTMCETSMGTSMDDGIKSISQKYFKAILTLGECTVARMIRIWFYLEAIFQMSNLVKKRDKAIKDLHTFTKNIINERRCYRKDKDLSKFQDDELDGKKGRLAMLDLLLEMEREGKIDEDGVREEVDTFMFEGYDTTATALCFLMMRIANEQDIQNKIFAEMNHIFGRSNRMPTADDLAGMKYLECCIKESLRIYPSVPFIARQITEDVVLSGYKVPANTICQIHVYDVHHREDFFPHPENFNPDRFLPENCYKRHPYCYIPFSAGPRNCIGQKFAMLEMKTIMSAVLRKFRLEPVTKWQDITFTVDIVLRASHPICVRFVERTNDK